MKAYRVSITNAAEQDVEDIHDYVAELDSPRKAIALLSKFDAAIERLEDSPERGSYPKETLSLGIREFRQLTVGPYRIVYRVSGRKVVILLVADGRRDMKSLLERRLFAPE